MTNRATYLVDSDVFITAKNLYYAFGLCPGFWKSVLHHHRRGRIFSVDRVRSELLAGTETEDLVRWVKEEVPKEFFLPVDADAVVSAYTEIMMWVQRHGRYFDHAKAKFATGADGWLVACARVQGAAVVTNEREAPESRRGDQTARRVRGVRCGAPQRLRDPSGAGRPVRLDGGRLSDPHARRSAGYRIST